MKLTTPIAILLSGFLIAGVVGYTNSQTGAISGPAGANDATEVSQADQLAQVLTERQEPEVNQLDNVLPVDELDHVRGAADPKITIIEYSDYECPFCKRFHDTLKQVMNDYGDSVAWVYRHFPLESLHPEKAYREALAAECAADQQGSDGFWQFSDRFLELTPSNNRTDLEVVLPQIAEEMGLDQTKFFSCIDTRKFADKVDRDLANAEATGGRGTPWSIMILPDGSTFPINGAQPYEVVSQMIDAALEIPQA